jgi:glycosyltransferase involved in cell wall biosynthesis
MIVKNEADALPRCLESVERAVDEVIVVDTGSTDDTVAIARSFGAQVVHFPWRDDFAAARNAGIERATKDWILFLDADECLDPADKVKLRLWAQNEQIDGCFMQINNYIADGSQLGPIGSVLRMFKNRPEHRFEGRIHEQIAPSINRHNPNAVYAATDVKIHHYGYMDETVVKKDKINRNLKLLRQMLEDNPDDPFVLYNIGMEYFRVGDLNNALESFRDAKKHLSPEYNFSHMVFYKETQCLQMLGRYQEANRSCDEGIGFYPDYTDLYLFKGFGFMQTGQWKEAASAFLRAYELGEPPKMYTTEEGIGTYQPCYMLGLVNEELCDFGNALDWYVKALRHKPDFDLPLYRISRLMKCTGTAASAIPALPKEIISPQSEEAAAAMIGILLEDDHFGPVMALVKQLKSVKYKPLKIEAMMKCLLLLGHEKKARRLLPLMREEDRHDYDVLLAWLETEKPPKAEQLSLRTGLIPLAIKAAIRRGRAEDALALFRRWREEMQSAEASIEMARTMTGLADYRLESFSACESAAEYRDIVQNARRMLPSNGFMFG